MLEKHHYDEIKKYITSEKNRLVFFKFIYKILPYFVFFSYPALLVFLFLNEKSLLLRSVTVPLGVFFTVTMIRDFLNFKRPYEELDITPIFPKSTVGHSFPSRHTACAAVIAMTFLYVNVPIGAFFVLISFLIALSRIAAGVHYPRDVAAGFLYSVLMSVLFFFVL